MKILYPLTIIASLFSLNLLAQENVVIIPRTEEIYEDSSAHNRMDKNWMLTGQLYGGTRNLQTYGLTVGKYLNRNSLVVLEILSAKDGTSRWSWSSSSTYYSSYDITGGVVGLYLKNFASNSFYYKLGLESKRVSYDHRRGDSSFTSSNYQGKFDGTSLSAAIVIGNQWQWKNFTLGCDWIGWSQALTSSVSGVIQSGGDSYDDKILKDDQERYVTNSVAQGLHFYLGASF